VDRHAPPEDFQRIAAQIPVFRITADRSAHGFDVVAQPESFLMTKQDRLYPQETTRGGVGTKLAASVVPSRPRHGRSRDAPNRLIWVRGQ
jgi:hypothetical protein